MKKKNPSEKLFSPRNNELESYYDDAEFVQTGDYVLWDTRLAHSTGERNTFSASEELRQAFYCSFVLQSQDESGLHKRMIQSCREMSTTPEWAPSSSSSPFLSGFEAETLKSSVGKALYVVNQLMMILTHETFISTDNTHSPLTILTSQVRIQQQIKKRTKPR